MGGPGSGRHIGSNRAPKQDLRHLSKEEKEERNRQYARDRWERLKKEKDESSELSGYQLYKANYKLKYHDDEQRIGHLREKSLGFRIDEDPREWLKYIREKNKRVLDEILNDEERMKYIFSDRDDIPFLQQREQKKKEHLSEKEIKEIEKRLNEEFNLVEDRRGNSYSTFKPINEQTNE